MTRVRCWSALCLLTAAALGCGCGGGGVGGGGSPGGGGGSPGGGGGSPGGDAGPGPGGDVVFPIGVWLQHASAKAAGNGKTDAENYRDAGVNTYVGLWKFPYDGWYEAEDSATALAELQRLGLHAYAGSDRTAVEWIADHPEYAATLVGYALGDEADMNKVNVVSRCAEATPAQLADPTMPAGWRSAGDALRTADASRGRYANFGKGFALDPWSGYSVCPGPTQADDFASYVEPLTVLSSDYYGITDPWEPRSEHGIWTYGRAVSHVRAYAGGRPVWGFVEGSAPCSESAGGAGSADRYLAFRMPAAWIAPAVWNMVIHGAQGIVYFCHDFSTRGNTGGCLGQPETLAAMAVVDADVQQYAAVLVQADVPGTTAVTDGDVAVTTLTRQLKGVTYVFAQGDGDSRHLDGQAVGATITVPGGGNRTVEVVGEGRTVSMAGGALRDHFDAYQVHVYRYR